MASFIVQAAPVFATGASLKAYPASNWPAHQQPPAVGSSPVGSATETVTIAATGLAIFSSLDAGTVYYLTVDGTGRYLRAETPVPDETVTADAGEGPWPVTDNGGSLTVDLVSEATAGAAVPMRAVLVAGSDGTNARNVATDAAGVQKVDIAGADITVPVKATVASSAVAQVASSAISVTLQASSASRRGLLIFNDSTAILRVKFGTTASATDYTVQVPPGGYYELPSPVYTGRVDGIWASANGNAYVTETS